VDNPEYPPLREPVLGEDGLFTPAWQRYFTQSLIPYLERVDSAEINNFTTTSNEQQGMFLQAIEDLRGFFLGSMPLASNELLDRIEELEGLLLAQPYLHPVMPEGNISNHAIVRGDGGENVVQDSNATIDDSGEVTAVGAILGSGGNHTEVQPHGEIRLHGNARVWRSIDLDPNRVKLPGANPPAEANIDGFGFHRYNRGTEQSVYFHWGIPDDYADGSANVRGFFKFVVEKPSTSTDEVVVMGFEYKKICEGDVFDFDAGTTTGTISETIVEDEVAWTTHLTDLGTCSTTGWTHGDTILFRFFRDATNVADTYDSEASADDNDVWVWDYHLEYLSDRIGSPYFTGEMWGANMWGANMWGANMWSQAS